MSQDTTNRPSTEEAARPQPFIPCSDCRAPMRNHYFTLDTRPVCPRCRTKYEKEIGYATGPGSLRRVLLWGGGTALLGSLVLGVVGYYVFRLVILLLSIGLAWLVARAINKATGGYFLRRNQVLGAVMVYFAVGLSSVAPIVATAIFVSPRLEAEAAAKAAERAKADSVAQAEAAAADDEEQMFDLEPEPEPEPVAAEEASITAGSIDQQKAAELRSGNVVMGVVKLFVLIVTMPLLNALVAGLFGAGAGIAALIYAMRVVWTQTSDGVSYTLSGPHRVGTGPIATTY